MASWVDATRLARSRGRSRITGVLVALASTATIATAPMPAAAQPAAGPETALLRTEPSVAAAGLEVVFDTLGVDALTRAWSELLSAPGPGELGGPDATLGWRETLAFYDGRLVFTHVFTVAEGLGPHYNDSACSHCHRSPAIGGDGEARDLVVGHAPAWTGGDAVGVRKHAIAGFEAEVVEGPTSKMRTPPLFGLGLLDAVPEQARAALEDPDDRDGDGVRGRRGWRFGEGRERPSRFGQKANEWDLARFAASAMADEIGITNTVRRDGRGDRDAVGDPELDRGTVERVIAFVRYLARPPALPRDAIAERGRLRFEALGCATCHRPVLGTLEGAYTDLLLHDMGEGLVGLNDGRAGARDWRTAPLWGLRLRRLLMHDGRARSPQAAVQLHDGEAKRARDAFAALPAAARGEVLAFLGTL